MKDTEVIPLYKAKEKDLCKNYRPISLLLTISKILEKIMYKRTYDFLDINRQLYNSQYGFRSKHSCENAISELVGHIIKGHERKVHTAAIFSDLSKAFDMLDHQLLLQKLEIYGTRGTPLKWFASYLKNRNMRVKYNSDEKQVLSNWQPIRHGAPQGSCLGPLLFLIFCNDLHLNLTYLSCIQFADDTTLYYTHSNLRVLHACIEYDLTNLYDWFGANSLTLNIDKTNLLLFDHRNRQNKGFTIDINGITLNSVTSAKFLSVMLDDRLTWNKHVEKLKVKLKRAFGLLCKGKNLLSSHELKMLYYAQFYSHLSYCIVLWGSMLISDQKRKVKSLQNNSVKLLNKTEQLNEIYKQHRIIKLDDLVDLEQKKLGYKLNNNLLPPNLEKVLLTDHVGKTLKKQHKYNTRQKDNPNLPKHQSRLYSDSFLVRSIKNYSEVSATVKNSKNIHQFAQCIKEAAIMSYNI